jgi:hypothetical protein
MINYIMKKVQQKFGMMKVRKVEIKKEEWYINDKLHNEKGPAEIWYYKMGINEENHGILMINFIMKMVQQKFCIIKIEINGENVGILMVNYIMKKVQQIFGI